MDSDLTEKESGEGLKDEICDEMKDGMIGTNVRTGRNRPSDHQPQKAGDRRSYRGK